MPAQDAPAGEWQCAVKCHTAVAVPHIVYDLSDVFSFYVIFEITKLLKVIFSGCQAFRLYFVLTYILRSVPRVNRMLYALLSLRDV